MYTDCPSCGRQFRVRAQHLSEAQGVARCGYCGEQFNVLLRLHDAPQPRPPGAPAKPHSDAKQPPAASAASATDEPQFHIPPAAAVAPRPARARPPREVPMELLVDDADVPNSRVWAWSIAAILLLIGAAGQAAWFNRDWLLLRFPQIKPAAVELCARLACEVQRYRDLGAISLINRDVRLHPVYQETLLVNATMANGAGFAQPFPQLQLVLFDTGGNAIAQRVFAPSEYLDESIADEPGMQPGQPVHFALEISGAIENAVGFEFGFL